MKLFLLAATLSMFTTVIALADNAPTPDPSTAGVPTSSGERLNVEGLKQKYWAKGNEAELRVVQNRLYSKAGKLQLGIFGGWISSDPFLSIQNAGAELEYYFNEYFGLSLIGWKDFSSPSSAQNTLQQITNPPATANTNPPNSFYGLDAKLSLVYGKLSLLGKAIIYYDLYILGGAGVTSTQSGSDFTPYFGIGQQIYLTRLISLQANYYFMVYSENVLNSAGQVALTRTNDTNVINLGINFLF